MRRKRVLALLMTAVMAAAALAGCGNGKPAEKNGASDTSGAETTGEAGNKATGKALKIAIVSSPSGVDDGSFNQNIYHGIQMFIAKHKDSTVTPVREETGAAPAAVKAVQDVVADYDVIVCCGFQFSGIGDIAKENPDKKFILVDAFPSADNKPVVYDNVYAMQFAEQESGFLAGMAAALQTKTKKVAVVNGIAFPSNVNYQYGFESGVKYADKKYDAGAELVALKSYAGQDPAGKNVGGNYIGTFSDPAKGKVVGKALLDAGVDVMLVAAGGSGNGVFAAAKEAKDAMVIGCDVDQYKDGENGGKNIVLTSALKVMDINVDRQLEKILDGSFKGANEVLTAKTDSTGYVKAEGHQQLSADSIKKLDEAYALMKDGKIVPASSNNGHTTDNFPGLD